MKLYRGYGVLKRLKTGTKLHIFLTFKCTLKCSYCANEFYHNSKPKSKTLTPDEWMDLIESFPVKIREVTLTGGEPMLYKGFSELVNKILATGRFVKVITNLTLDNGLAVNSSYRVRYWATYHGSEASLIVPHQLSWIQRLEEYRKKFRVDVVELETNYIKGSIRKKIFNTEIEWDACIDHKYLIYAPDGSFYLTTREMYNEHI